MAYDEDFDDVMERKNKGSTICPVCFHEMTLDASFYHKGKRIRGPSYRCGDCGKRILI